MTGLSIRILAGPDAGQQKLLSQSPISFGRSGECTLVFDLPEVSRQHGELQFVDDAWQLVNISANGTKLGRKRVTKKPRPIADGDVVSVGKTQLFSLHVQSIGGEPAPADSGAGSFAKSSESPEQDAGADHDGQTDDEPTGKSKLWMYIGIYIALLFVGALVLKSIVGDSDANSSSSVQAMTSAQIEQVVQSPLEKNLPDRRRHLALLEQANELFKLRDTGQDVLYRAYETYRQSLSYSREPRFADPLDDRRYQKVQQELTELLQQRYEQACNLLKNRQFDRAAEAFERLAAFYPEPTSPVYQSIQKLWTQARQRGR